MAENLVKLNLFIDQPQTGTILLVVSDLDSGQEVAREELAYEGHVDNILLTAVDNLLKRSKLHKSALCTVTVGDGIDKNSSFFRIVESFASAVAVARKGVN